MSARFTRRSSSTPVRVEPAHGYRLAALLGATALLAALAGIALATDRSLSPLTWYIARASGVALYLLLWGTVALGLGLTTGLLDRIGGRGVVYSLHRFATDLAYGVLALHVGSLVLDDYVAFSPRDVLVPFLSEVREPWTGLGILTAWLWVIVGVGFGMQRWIGQRGWRALHTASYPLYLVALAHGLGAGRDATSPLLGALYLSTLTVIVFLTCFRLLRRGERTSAPLLPARRPDRAG